MNRIWQKGARRNGIHLVWLGAGLASVMSGAFAQQATDKWIAQLPEGKGKALVADACVQCHTLESTVVQRKDRAAWKRTVNDMILRGMLITPAEAESIIEYLSSTLGPTKAQASAGNPPGPLDLNTATLEDLLRAAPLERAEAEAILEHRSRHGPFRSVEDLKKVHVLRPERFEKIKALVSVSSAKRGTQPKQH